MQINIIYLINHLYVYLIVPTLFSTSSLLSQPDLIKICMHVIRVNLQHFLLRRRLHIEYPNIGCESTRNLMPAQG